ncbi:hypothetical protein HBI52_210190 [Parastagonospora nodorum]|nr:hypothetical protein HBI79_190930 [Parastagonospora nodorum]KAH5020904.1 hypothetical protein HBI74_148280 [Parastagonospora nodorum]KAH5070540.1 hypothetical protein HBH96_009970 [Parastagonospora nodorum]KAH5493352.1 hypothetical protein HBI52_210190 [Parastagonospora nodorum]KAH6192992.1 hypothetical protein HBI53_202600 [Parastagonospora nodorum]
MVRGIRTGKSRPCSLQMPASLMAPSKASSIFDTDCSRDMHGFACSGQQGGVCGQHLRASCNTVSTSSNSRRLRTSFAQVALARL